MSYNVKGLLGEKAWHDPGMGREQQGCSRYRR